MFDIITFGSATTDVYVISKDFLVVGEKKLSTGKGLCMSSGSKIEVENVMFKSGGGGTNAAATFSKQGLKVAWCGMIGKDLGGEVVLKELKELGIDSRFVFKTAERPTNYSVVLTYPGKERTILVYRGASGNLSRKDIPFKKLSAKWIYLAPLSGKLCSLFETLVNFAYKNKIKIAVNPGSAQLSLPKKTLDRILQKVDVLILNQEEASSLTKIPFKKEKEIFKKLDKQVKGIAIMTKGEDGATISDGKYLYTAKSSKVKVVDRTGAGDAFGAGFVSGFIKTKNIEKAMQLAIANANGCLEQWGAKQGLLSSKSFKKVKIKKQSCQKNGLCKVK